MNLLNIIKLAKVIAKLEKVNSDQGPVIVENIETGAEIFIDGPEGEVIPAPDGSYLVETANGNKKLRVKGGKIETIEEVPAVPDKLEDEEEEKKKCEEEPKEEEPAGETVEPKEETKEEEPKEEKAEGEPDEKDAKIADLIAEIAEKEAKIAELEAEINSLKSAPAKTEFKEVKNVSPFRTYKH